MENIIVSVLSDVLMLLATVGAGYLVVFLKKKLGVEKLRKLQQESEFVKQIVKLGVQYAEQKYVSGEKLDAASEWIVARLAEKGILVSKDEVEGLIEATIRQFKDEFGESWGREANNVK